MTGPNTSKFFLRTMGGLSIEADGATWSGLVNQRKTLGLLALLAVAGDRGVSRDKIMALLWPESGSDQARNALSQLVFRIRRELGGDVLSGNAELRLNADLMSSDVAMVQKAASEGQFEAVAQAYSGPFLDGVYIKDAPDFERWAADERQRFEQVFFDALDKLARQATHENNHIAAAAWTARRAAVDPLSARAAKSHIEALVAAGDRESALRFGRDYGTLVRAQLETEPDPEITRVLDHIRTSVVAASSNGGAPHSIPVPTAGAPSDSADPALSRQANSHPGATRRRAVVAALGIPLVAFGLVVVYTAAGADSSTERIVVVAPFENAVGDTSFNGIGRAAEAMLTYSLQRTGIVGVVDASMDMAAPSPSDREGARQAALAGIVARTDASIIVAGQLFRAGADSLELRSRIVDARSGRVLNVLNPIRLRPDAPDSALLELRDRVTGALAALIDPRLASLREEGAPPPQFAAYLEFVEGIDFFTGKRGVRGFDNAGSIPHFTRAAQLDTMWNLPLSWLAFAYGNMGNGRLKDSVVDVLESRRYRLAPLDRHALDFFLAQRIHDNEAMYRAVVSAAKLAPASNWTYVQGLRATDTRRDDEAITAFRTLDGDGGWIQGWIYYRIAYANTLHLRGRSDEELRVAREGARKNPDPNMYDALFRALGSRGAVRALDQLVDSIALLPNAILLHSRTGNSLARAASEASVHGYPEAATHLARRCVDWIEAHPPIGNGPPMDPINRQIALNALGQCLFMLERYDEALTRSVEAAQDHPSFGPLAMIRQVLIALRQQDSVTAHRRIAEAYALPQFFPDSNNRSLLDALIAASAGDAGGTARHLGNRGRSFWHERVEITPSLRRSRELRALLESR